MLVKKMTDQDILGLRKILCLNQRTFSRKFLIPIKRLRKIERGIIKPNGTELFLFNLLRKLTVRKCSTQDFLYELKFERKK